MEAVKKDDADGVGIGGDSILASPLSGHISNAWSQARMAKQQITERLLKCERQRRGEYDPDHAAEIAKSGGSDIFMMITDVKCNAARSWILDVMNQGERPFALEPAQDPTLPPEIKLSIISLVQQEAQEFLAQGQQIHPEAFRQRLQEVHDMVLLRMREEGKETAERMAGLIQDQLESGGYRAAMEDFTDDFVTYPTAILKGPTVRKKPRLTWGPGFKPVVIEDYNRDVERVSPHDIFPGPSSSGVDDSFLIQRHRLTAKDLESMKGVAGYRDDEIEQVILRYGTSGFKYYDTNDMERNALEGKHMSGVLRDSLIEALEYWGPVMGSMLLDWGMTNVEPNKTYEVNAWQVGSFVIKAIVNPDPLGERPYEIASWRSIPGAFWGGALPEIIRDVQLMCNASARALANNMGIASGPQIDLSVDRLADGEDVTQMYPWKIWQTTSDRTGGNQPAIRFFMPDMKAGELMLVYNQFQRQADEVTGIPNYIYGGGNGGGGAGRTASGLSMLMDNAAKGIKSAILMIDRVVKMIVSRFYVHNMMYHPDPYIKGDFNVVALGAMGLIHQEQIAMRRTEFLAATANPVDLQIVGAEGRAYMLREQAKALQMDTDKIIPPPEMMKFKAEKVEQAMAAQQAAQPQQPQQIAPPGGGQEQPPGPEPVNTVQPQAPIQ